VFFSNFFVAVYMRSWEGVCLYFIYLLTEMLSCRMP